MKVLSQRTGQHQGSRTVWCTVLVLLGQCAAGHAQFTYTTNSPNTSTITITGYTGAGGAVSIPATIGGRTVTAIGGMAFTNASSITRLTIPAGVVSIGVGAFQRCTGLTNVVFPASLASIDSAAFNLCESLPNIVVPAGVTYLGEGPFAQCANLTNISVAAGNAAFRDIDGVLFDWNQSRLIQCPGARSGTYVVPDGVVRIETIAFSRCNNLTNIAIPDGVTDIGTATFSSCLGLTALLFPASTTNLGPWALAYCDNLADVYFCGNAPDADLNLLTNSSQVVVWHLPGTTGWPIAPAPWKNRPTALWLPEMLTVSSGAFGEPLGFTGTWAAGQTAVVETCTRLFDPEWTPAQTCVFSEGTAVFSVPQSTNDPTRFYRLRPTF